MNTIIITVIFAIFIIIVSISSFIFAMHTYNLNPSLIGKKLDNSDEAISDAMDYFVLTNLVEPNKND